MATLPRWYLEVLNALAEEDALDPREKYLNSILGTDITKQLAQDRWQTNPEQTVSLNAIPGENVNLPASQLKMNPAQIVSLDGVIGTDVALPQEQLITDPRQTVSLNGPVTVEGENVNLPQEQLVMDTRQRTGLPKWYQDVVTSIQNAEATNPYYPPVQDNPASPEVIAPVADYPEIPASMIATRSDQTVLPPVNSKPAKKSSGSKTKTKSVLKQTSADPMQDLIDGLNARQPTYMPKRTANKIYERYL
ncbi:MAG: hypothetical protein IJV29_14820 [Butyrivibrio sp.]|nr:hypothetical protein [Butyrivibrio sp.]